MIRPLHEWPRRLPLRALAGLALLLAGCEGASSGTPPTTAGGALSTTADGSLPGSLRRAASPAGAPDQAKTTAAPAVAGDRLANADVEEIDLNDRSEASPFRFAEITGPAGIDFVHFSGMTEDKHFPTANGSGLAVFDYDGDGRMDLYFATCTLLPLGKGQKGPNRLYRNLGGGKFEETTKKAGLDFAGFCHGVIACDLDNDGDQDVVLCNYGPNVLYRNNGDGTFTDVTEGSGMGSPNWSSGGAPIDYDNDGDLDLYISNYGEWKYPEDDRFCGNADKHVRLYCSPREIRTVKHLFYRNDGNLKFTDVYDDVFLAYDDQTQGLKKAPRDDGHGFGVVTSDLNGDGRPDIYVANDLTPNFLFLNRGDGTFEDVTEASGAAFDDRGQAQSSMGVEAEDVDGDGRPDLYVTNFQNEYNTLYINMATSAPPKEGEVPPVAFMDSTAFFGLAADSMPFVGWGCALADFDSDGWPDSFVANGHVDNNRAQLGQKIPYEEPPLLHRNVAVDAAQKGTPSASRRFKLSLRDVGPYFAARHVARGAAFGDLDDDGDIDIVVSHKDGPPAVLRNDTPRNGNAWIRLKLTGSKSNRDAVGAKIEVEAGGRTLYRQRKGGCSMESTNDPRVTVGLGAVREVARLTVRWPSGLVTVREHLEPNREYALDEARDAQP